MQEKNRNDFISRLREADSPTAHVAACKLIRDLLGDFSRTAEDISTIAQAVRTTASKFPADAAVEMIQKGTGDAKAKPVTISLQMQQYAAETAKWVEGLSPLTVTVGVPVMRPPTPQPEPSAVPQAQA